MALFESKSIGFSDETVGQQLRRAREEKKLAIVAVAKKLVIRPVYLEALETGDRRRLPKGVYARNFLREYARFLGLDYRSLVKQFLTENGEGEKISPKPFERRIVGKKQLMAVPIVTRNIIIGFIAALCLIYLAILVKNIFQPPFLTISQPASDLTTQNRQLTVSGRTVPETDVRLNGQSVQVDSQGNFRQDVYLEKGLNTIIITARKKYSRTATIVRHILFEETSP